MTTAPVADTVAGLVSFERRLLVSGADRIARAPSLPVKMTLCRWVWGTARRIRRLHRLLPAELATRAIESSPDARSAELLDRMTALAGEDAYLAALSGVVAPHVAAGYARARELAAANDTGLRRHLRSAMREHAAVQRLRPRRGGGGSRRAGDVDTVAVRELASLSRFIGGGRVALGEAVDGDALRRTSPELGEPARERVVRALRHGEAREETWFVSSPADYHRYLHQLIGFEINTFEAASRHIAEFASMPWEFHWDMACQIADELAHLEMWLERLPRVGGRLGAYPLGTYEFGVCLGHDLRGRVALLERLVESSALDAIALNRCLWETRADAVMVAYLDRVQSDEIAHVRQGNKWLRRLCGSEDALVALVDDAEATSRARMLEAAERLERDGLVPPGNRERMRRKLDDPLYLDVARTVRLAAGFSEEEIGREIARRRDRIVCGEER